jgi:hypothetical protein
MMRKIRIPSLTESDLAYETGVHIGDGCMQIFPSKHDYRVTFWGSVEEFNYYDKILKTILIKLYDLRNIAIRKVSTENTIYLRVCSKQMVLFKHDVLGLPCGKKSKIETLPVFVKNSEKLLKECISGLFDTDSSLRFIRKREKYDYPQISLKSSNENLAKDVNKQLNDLGFNTAFHFENLIDSRTGKRYPLWIIDINGRKMLEKWMKEISFRNSIHLTKYGIWKKHGFCPPKTTLQQRLKILDKS